MTLLAFGAALAQDAYLHTDDGCVVETHCLACRWHLGTTGTTVEAAPLGPPSLVVWPLYLSSEYHTAQGDVRVAVARPPPIS